MSRFEYLLPLISVLIGLAMADLVTSLHRLLRSRERVRWHWIPLLWTGLTFLILVAYWWAFFRVGQTEAFDNILVFSFHLVLLVLLFLVAAAVLPDDVPEQGVDLLAYYLAQRKYFFGLYIVYYAWAMIDGFVRSGDWWQPTHWITLAMILLSGVLAWSSRVRVHAFVSAGVLLIAVVVIVRYYARLG